MADFKVNQISNKNGDQGPTIAGVTTVSSTGAMRIPSGATDYGRIIKEDPYYEFLSIALPFNEPANSQVFRDYSKYGDQYIVSGDVLQKSDQSKFYGTSAYWDGTGDRIYTPTVSGYELGDRFVTGTHGSWTFEVWMRHKGSDNNSGILFTDNTVDQVSNGYYGRTISITGNDGTVCSSFQRNNGADLSRVWDQASTVNAGYGGMIPKNTYTSDEWQHIAISFDGPAGVWRQFISGTLVGTVAYADQDDILRKNGVDPADVDYFLINKNSLVRLPISRRDFRSGTVHIGANHANAHSGTFWLNDYRLYQGVCKYKESFTPPTQMAF